MWFYGERDIFIWLNAKEVFKMPRMNNAVVLKFAWRETFFLFSYHFSSWLSLTVVFVLKSFSNSASQGLHKE